MQTNTQASASPQEVLVNELNSIFHRLADAHRDLTRLRQLANELPHHECEFDEKDEPAYDSVIRDLEDLEIDVNVEIGCFPTRRTRPARVAR